MSGAGPVASEVNVAVVPSFAATSTGEMVKDGGAANGKSPLMVGWGPVLNDDAKVRDASSIQVEVTRRGKPVTLNYTIH